MPPRRSPHEADACLFGVLDQMCARALNPRLADLVDAHPRLAAYRARVRARYFGPQYELEVAWADGPSAAPTASRQGGKEGVAGGGGKGAAEAADKKEE